MASRPRLDFLEIDITYKCTLRCYNCNRLISIRPGGETEQVSVDDIRRLIAESERCGYPWRRWWLIGGEPTIHPQLKEMVRLVARYRDRRGPPYFALGIATNGFTEQTRRVIAEIKKEFPFVDILNSRKRGRENPHFVAVGVAAVDRGIPEDHRYIGCGVSWNCGLGMNFLGFYPCAVAGAIDRVLMIGERVHSVDEINREAMERLWQTYCRLCGYYGKPICEGKETVISRAWLDRLRQVGIDVSEMALWEGRESESVDDQPRAEVARENL